MNVFVISSKGKCEVLCVFEISKDSFDVLMKAIAERGRYESLPIFFGCDAIDLQLSIDHGRRRQLPGLLCNFAGPVDNGWTQRLQG